MVCPQATALPSPAVVAVLSGAGFSGRHYILWLLVQKVRALSSSLPKLSPKTASSSHSQHRGGPIQRSDGDEV